jgi:phage gpG-like protein
VRIDVEISEDTVSAALSALSDAGGDLRPALEQIGDYLIDSTRQRFQDGVSPDGTPWAPNSETTYMRFLGAFKGSLTKRGQVSARGAERAQGKKPLIGETRSLSTMIVKQVGEDYLDVGSPMEYAGVQHRGAKKGEFGSDRHGRPIPWGDIPARPIFGLSSADRAEMVEILREHLVRARG